jgi:hypothetical protein
MNRLAVTCFFVVSSTLRGQALPEKATRLGEFFPPEIDAARVIVSGLNGSAIQLTTADLAKLPRQTVKASDHAFEGVLLSDLLAKVEAPTGEKYRSTAASYYVVVQARDGYRAVFSWAEVDPTFTDRKVYLVTRRDGRPLVGKDGPFLTVVPDDKRQSRWVRQAIEVTIVATGSAAAHD